MTDCYTRVNQQYQPINMIPTGQIKCSTCNQMFSLNKIDQHLNSHIQPKYLVPHQQETNLKKMSVTNQFLKDINDDQTDIAVRSLMPQELPQLQSERKKIPFIQVDNSLDQPSLHAHKIKIQADPSDITSRIGQIGGQNNDFDLLFLEKDIDMPPKYARVNRKQLHLYENRRDEKQNLNMVRVQKKVRKNQESKVNQAVYDLVSQQSFKKQNQKNVNVDRFEVPISYMKRPKEKLLVSTTTGGNWRTAKNDQEDAKTEDGGYDFNQSKFTHSRMNGLKDNLSCPCCGGFYCDTCKSDIPPMFRPPPGKEVHTREIKAFWAHFNRIQPTVKCSQCDP